MDASVTHLAATRVCYQKSVGSPGFNYQISLHSILPHNIIYVCFQLSRDVIKQEKHSWTHCINAFCSCKSMDTENGTKTGMENDCMPQNTSQFAQHAHRRRADTTCLVVRFTYLAPTPLFRYILMSPKHRYIICTLW